MNNQTISIAELPNFLILQLKKTKSRKEKLLIIENFVRAIIMRKQRLSDLFQNFRCAFAIEPSKEIKQYLYGIKDAFDNDNKTDDAKITQLALYILSKSPLCEDEIVYLKDIPQQVNEILALKS